MKKSSFLPRFLTQAAFGSLVIIMLIPWLRIGSIQLLLPYTKYQLGKNVPGPALKRLLQVDDWSATYPTLFSTVQRDKALCYAKLGDMDTALAIAEATLQGPATRELDFRSILDSHDVRTFVLLYPNKAANWLLQKRYPSPAETATMPLAALDEIYQADGDEASRRHIRELIASAPPPTTVESDPDSPTPPTTASSTPPPRRHIDQNSEWGVTSAEGARAYSTSGKFIGRLPVGTVMEITDIRQSPKGDLASCTLGNPVAGMPAQVLIKSKDLTTWRGALADVSPQERKLRGDQASLQANIESRVVAIGKGHEQRNPNNAAYQSALSNYRDVYKRSEALKKLRDSTTGVKRQEAANKLKQMKGEGAAVSRKYEAIKIDYEAWKRSNPPPSANDDKTILRLRRRVDQIDDEIRRLDV